MDISVITFDSASAEMKTINDIGELSACPDDKTMWLNINGLKEIDSITRLAKQYNVHPLTIEDIFNTRQQPKVERFDNYSYISFKSIQHEQSFHNEQTRPKKKSGADSKKVKKIQEDNDEFCIDQISLIVMDKVIITIQEIPGDPFYGIRKRILENAGQIRRMNTDYLAYSLIDAVVDDYFLTLSHIQEDIENFEDRAVKTTDDKFVFEIQDTKKSLFLIKQAILPLRDNLLTINRQKILIINDEFKPFLQDLQENCNNAVQRVENCRDWLSNIMQVNLSMLSYQMNKVMKILAIVSTIFIPLTFIAGVYGMNFDFMPELSLHYAYPVVLGGMGMIAVIMLIIFKIRHWF
ncbi:MAG: magnesium/cobalt transporter CorA [Treponema sp.]|nr:magnesium/cobalt transporter CorA [Treponema sp.]